MSFKNQLRESVGIFLMLVIAVSTIWLAHTGQLKLYIHPRYVIFTATFAVIGVLFGMLSAYLPTVHTEKKQTSRSTFRNISTAVMVIVFATVMLVIKPSTLTTATANQRGINVSAQDVTVSSTTRKYFDSSNYSRLTIKDWASLLSQTSDPAFFANKQPSLTGFVVADEDDPNNVFYVSRFIITCCAVDARPVGVPVYYQNWKEKYAPDQWLEVSGEFVENKMSNSKQRLLLRPASLAIVEQPKDPYVY